MTLTRPPDGGRRTALPRRGRGPALGAGAHPGRLAGDRRRQRLHRRLGRIAAAARRAPSSTSPAAASAPPAMPDCSRPTAEIVCFCDCDASLDPALLARLRPRRSRPATADLVLGRRRPPGPRRLAAARPGWATSRWPGCCAAAPGCGCTTSARCGPPGARRCSASASPTGAAATRCRWSCGPPTRAGGSPSGTCPTCRAPGSPRSPAPGAAPGTPCGTCGRVLRRTAARPCRTRLARPGSRDVAAARSRAGTGTAR